MAFLVSPGVEVKEKDLTNIIPAVATSAGGFAGVFEWGPCLEVTTVSSEKDLIDKFGYPRISSNPGSNSRLDWYTAANFLSYTNNVQTVRVLPEGARNSVSEALTVSEDAVTIIVQGTPSTTNTVTIPYDGTANTIDITYASGDTPTTIVAKVAAALAAVGVTEVVTDDISVTYPLGTKTMPPASATLDSVSYSYVKTQVDSTSGDVISTASLANENEFQVERSSLVNGSVYARYPGKLGDSIAITVIDANMSNDDFANTVLFGSVKASDYFDDKPETSVWGKNNHNDNLNDEVHVIVYTTSDQITGNAGDVLETFSFLSKAKNAKTSDGGPNYYVDVINDTSKWVYLLDEETAATNSVTAITNGISSGSTLTSTSTFSFNPFLTNVGIDGVRSYELGGGRDGASVTDGDYTKGYDLLSDVDAVDVNLLITGARSKVVQKYVVEIGERRKDAITFVSPDYAAAVQNPTAAKIIEYFNSSVDGFNSTSYAVFDSGWKRQYDRYNDDYFWVPLCADTAGLAARTDSTNDAWWSPAGLNRGFVKNSIKLSYNPNQTDRDALYVKRVNPVVTFRGQGTLLYGDKTALSRPSAFDRINVRRLFIVLEKAIATAAKYQLFEFNDDLTRRIFINAVEPFLADVKSRRGMTDFKVVCDSSNNTGEVVDGNRFVADIYIKPNRSINFITLNFTAVRSGVSFSEVAGA